MSDLKCKRGIVVYPGKETYTIKEGIRAIPIGKLGMGTINKLIA